MVIGKKIRYSLIAATVVLAFLFIALAYKRFLQKKDMDLICKIHTKYLSEYKEHYKSEQEIDIAQIAAMTANEIHDGIKTREVKTCLEIIATADPDQKYEYYQKCAEELKYPSWKCPAMIEIRALEKRHTEKITAN